MTDSKPNILLICVDQSRADCLGVEGHPAVQTPHLDRLAQDGFRFRHAYSATPTCVPAKAVLLTGLKPSNHGFVGYDDHRYWHYETTLPSVLADAGYHTQCVGKMHVHPARNLLGFHNVVLHDGFLHRERTKTDAPGPTDDYRFWLRNELGQEADDTDSVHGCNGYVAGPWPYPEHTHPTAWATTQSIDFLRRKDPTQPFSSRFPTTARTHRSTRLRVCWGATATDPCRKSPLATGLNPSFLLLEVTIAPYPTPLPRATMPAAPTTPR